MILLDSKFNGRIAQFVGSLSGSRSSPPSGSQLLMDDSGASWEKLKFSTVGMVSKNSIAANP